MNNNSSNQDLNRNGWLILAFVFVGMFAYLSLKDSGVATTAAPSAPKQWRTVKTWSGSGKTNTEPFTITSSPFRVNWTVIPDVGATGKKHTAFRVFLYNPDSNKLVEGLTNGIYTSDSKGSTMVYKSGEFYLELGGGSASWEVTVEE